MMLPLPEKLEIKKRLIKLWNEFRGCVWWRWWRRGRTGVMVEECAVEFGIFWFGIGGGML